MLFEKLKKREKKQSEKINKKASMEGKNKSRFVDDLGLYRGKREL